MKNMFALLALSLGLSSFAQAIDITYLPAESVITLNNNVVFQIGETSKVVAQLTEKNGQVYYSCSVDVYSGNVKTGLILNSPIQVTVSNVVLSERGYVILGQFNKKSVRSITCTGHTGTIEKLVEIITASGGTIQIPGPAVE